MKTKDIKKHKKILIVISAVVLLFLIVLTAIKLNIFNFNKEEESTDIYQGYKQTCSKDDSYFEELANLAGGGYKKVNEIKSKSIFCETGSKENITAEKFESLNCECKGYGKRMCKEGWQLIGSYCYKDNLYTNALKTCSFYKCEGNYYIEIIEKQ